MAVKVSNAKALKWHSQVYPLIPNYGLTKTSLNFHTLLNMAPKRKTADAEHTHPDTQDKRFKKGFSVGPANLPDGTHRRKGTISAPRKPIRTNPWTVLKIKQDLIRKAKVKKSYSKIKDRENVDTKPSIYSSTPPPEEPSASLELHPERKAMLDEPEPVPVPREQNDKQQQLPQKKKPPRPKSVPFRKETLLAQQRREENGKRQNEFEEASRQRQAKIEERERFRKAMAKARSGSSTGQRKLGRESKVLLEKVQRMVRP